MPLDAQFRQNWTSKIESALSLQAEQKARWDTSLEFLRLKWFENNLGDIETERTEVHFVWAFFNTAIPTLYAKDPHLFVKPRRSSATPFADTMEEVLNYEKDELKLKAAVHKAIADTIPYGMGWVEVGYTPPPGSRRPSLRAPTLVAQVKEQVNKLLNGPPAEEMAEGQLLPDVRGGKIFLRWIPAYRVLLAPGYHTIEEMPYLIVTEDVAPEEFKSNPRYNQAVVDKVKPGRLLFSKGGKVLSPQKRIATISQPRLDDGTKGDTKFIRIFHIHDRRNLRKIGFAQGEPQELYDEPWGSSFDEFSLVPLIFNSTPPDENDANAYPMDDITPLKPQLLEKSLLRTSMIKMRRRMAPIIIVDRDLYTDTEIAVLQESEEAVIIPVKGGAKGFFAVNPVRIPDEIFKIDGVIDKDLNLVGGFNNVVLAGESSPGDKTATEISQQGAGLNLRASRKIDIIEGFIVELARRMGAYCWEFCDRVDINDLLGKPISEEMWPDIQQLEDSEKVKKIRREISFRIEAGATQPEQARFIESNLWIRAINMLKAAFPDRFDDAKLLEQFLKKMGMKELEYVIKSDDDIERRHAEAENQLLLANVPQLVGPNDMDEIHLEVHGVAAQGDSTPAMDSHIQSHAQNRARKNPKVKPQEGDVTSPQQAAVPELQRTGGEDIGDLLGGAGNSVGGGPENSLTQ